MIARCLLRRHRRSIAAGLSAIVLAGVSPSARSQLIDVPYARVPYEGKATTDQVRRVMYAYARCMVRQKRIAIEAYLKTVPGSPDAYNAIERIKLSECLQAGTLRFSEVVFRAGVYDVLYAQKFGSHPVNLDGAPSLDLPRAGFDEQTGAAEAWANQRALAECAVRKAPEDARAIVATPVASPAEALAFRQMVPAFSACLYKDATVKLSPFALRGYIGEILYRLSVATTANKS